MVAPTLESVASTTSTVQIGFRNNGPAGSNFLAELNRASDFSGDDTIFFRVDGAAAGSGNAFTAAGLPSGTPWHVRLTSLEGGSLRTLVATQPVTPATAYTGFSIEKAMLVVPEPIINLAGAANVPAAGYPLANMLSDSPAAITLWTVNDQQFNFDTSGAPIDTIALLGTLFNDDARWRVQAFSDAARTTAIYDSGVVPLRCSPTLGQRRVYHALASLASPVAARYWRVGFNSAGGTVPMLVRNLVVGLARQSINASRGWSHGLNDLGTAGRTRFGDPDIVPGWRGKTVDFELSWLTEREYQTKWADLPTLVGTTKPVLVIPNSKRNIWLNDRIGYGTITDYRAENTQGSRYTASIAVNSIY